MMSPYHFFFSHYYIIFRTWLVVVPLLLLVLATAGSSMSAPLTMMTAPNTTKPGCPRKCGNLTVPYPFGVGLGAGCSKDITYDILCLKSSPSSPPKALFPWATFNFNQSMIQVVDISETQIRIRNRVGYQCYNMTSTLVASAWTTSVQLNMDSDDTPYSVSASSNKLTVVGCNDGASFTGHSKSSVFSPDDGGTSCRSNCSSPGTVGPGDCNGVGCCQAVIPKGMRSYSVNFDLDSNNTDVASYNPCGYSFLGDPDRFAFRGAPDLNDPRFLSRLVEDVPLVLEWVIAPGETCDRAKLDPASYACQGNTTCVNATEAGIGGYRCSCLPGYQGNPYLPPGCTDINECEDPSGSPCSIICENTPGNYTCSCPSGYSGDGRKVGTGCKRQFPVLQFSLGVGFGTLFILIVSSWIFIALRKRRIMKMKEKFFKQNGGFLLKQLITPNQQDNVNLVKVFTVDELKVATKNFAEDRIVGKGGYGTVYKGILPNNEVVAIKRSKFVDEGQIEQFINELVILARIRHPNVVRILGCCLEVEVPLLVYEFISNGTLYDHIKNKDGPSWYSWSNCLRIAIESADALAYLHSVPIIHRDIKSTNILLDDNYTTKISDFGASRLIPLNQTHLSTMVQGTLGYLDPEYFMSSQLTEKSDVFSFGVVLAELLTRKGPLLPESKIEAHNYNLATFFVKSMRENNLFNILDPQLVEEVSPEQLISIAKLVRNCLSVSGEDRPTMKEVAMELQELIKQLK